MSRNDWLESITAEEYQELLELSAIEPVGSDAVIQQMAIVAQAMNGGRLSDLIVLSTKQEQTPEEMARLMGWPGHGNNSKP